MSSLARFSGSPVYTRPRTPALLMAWAKGVQVDSPSGLYSALYTGLNPSVGAASSFWSFTIFVVAIAPVR